MVNGSAGVDVKVGDSHRVANGFDYESANLIGA